MPRDVHPQIQAILDRAAELGLKPLQSMSVADGRAQAEAMAKMARQVFSPPDIPVIDEMTTGPTYGHVPVRIYRASLEAFAPVVVFYHGGGHVICSIETHDTIARSLALEAGCTVVSVGYRLAPEHPFPAAVDDSFDALRWVAENSSTLGVDLERISVCGDSAGGNLAAVVGLLAQDHAILKLSSQVLVYPVIDYRGGTGSAERYRQGYGSLTAETLKWFLNHYLPDAAQRDDWRACPYKARIPSDLPPALILLAECDVLHDDGVLYAEMLRQAGVDVDLEVFDGMTHGFFGFLGQVDAARRAHETVAAFLRRNWDYSA